MAKSTPKKQAAPAPMDASAREIAQPVASGNTPRDCWAIKTLVAEFTDLFPETSHETSNRDGRNTALAVTFYLGDLIEDDENAATNLLGLIGSDERVAHVTADDSHVLVEMRGNPRTQDSRESFGLADAYLVMIEDADEQMTFAPCPGADMECPPWETATFEGGSA